MLRPPIKIVKGEMLRKIGDPVDYAKIKDEPSINFE